jgi:hypothetical protein
LRSPEDEGARLRYDWIRLEMLDQLNRHTPGGDTIKFTYRSCAKIRDYLLKRMGRSGENLIPDPEKNEKKLPFQEMLRNIEWFFTSSITYLTPGSLRVGGFRLSGEVHLCMYDEYLLADLLANAGFREIVKLSAEESRIPNWNLTRLDCDSQGYPDSEASLFMESTKPDQDKR